MTDKTYTRQELEEMADQLLTADDKKKAEKTADKKPESDKTNDKTLEEKLGKCPAAALLAGNEKLRELFIKGKKKGRLEPAELSEVVDAMDLDGDPRWTASMTPWRIWASTSSPRISPTTSPRTWSPPWRRSPRSRRRSW